MDELDPAPDDPYDPHQTEVVLRELEGMAVEYPPQKELILRGRASIAGREYNPDDVVPPEVDEMAARGIPRKTLETYEYQWGRFIHWCGSEEIRREHKPPTIATMRYYIWSHWEARRPDGRGRGRKGRPYATATVRTAVYSVSAVLQWLGFASPMKHPFIHRQLKGYHAKWTEAGYKPDIAHALSPAESVAMARACDLSTVQGLRLAAMIRLHYDLGARASEVLGLNMDHVSWLQAGDQPQVNLWVKQSKNNPNGRALVVEAVPDVDGDVDPALLLGLWYDAMTEAGFTDGPLWREVNPGRPRKDGSLAGTIREEPLQLRAYEFAHDRCAARAGVTLDPKTKKESRRVTTHSNRAGMITAARDSGMLAEQVAARTGHSPGSDTIHSYWRGGTRLGDDNAGTRIRTRQRTTPEETPS